MNAALKARVAQATKIGFHSIVNIQEEGELIVVTIKRGVNKYETISLKAGDINPEMPAVDGLYKIRVNNEQWQFVEIKITGSWIQCTWKGEVVAEFDTINGKLWRGWYQGEWMGRQSILTVEFLKEELDLTRSPKIPHMKVLYN